MSPPVKSKSEKNFNQYIREIKSNHVNSNDSEDEAEPNVNSQEEDEIDEEKSSLLDSLNSNMENEIVSIEIKPKSSTEENNIYGEPSGLASMDLPSFLPPLPFQNPLGNNSNDLSDDEVKEYHHVFKDTFDDNTSNV